MSSLFGPGEVSGDQVALKATHKNHFNFQGPAKGEETPSQEFSAALKDALGETNNLQQDVSDLTRAYLTDPESVDAHDVTIAISKANMALDITKAVVDGAVKAYNNIINIR
ncbi:MAG: flagellar hook-basal body complex protein FliE [Spirochaetales bacterium]|uniref:Flagellar hook-basal body complex protein FliE n=1 Tax=Candidatus Thalassospirochaeta sargassi TaxID=3119039 RepID=A0AAJ1IFV4_9SPIO|nr:flagellar hook-basal body complex protein FliE [Spirochaetales bacterium]